MNEYEKTAKGSKSAETPCYAKIYGYTEKQLTAYGMKKSVDKHCPECGCPWYSNVNLLGKGSRVCCDCRQDWWEDINYEDISVARRELPKA